MTPIFHIDPPSVADAGDELSIQVRFRSQMRIVAPGVRLAAVPNGTYIATKAGRGKVRREGLAAGFPDMIALWGNGIGVNPVPGIAFLEFKSKTGSLQESQVDWLTWMTAAGQPCGVFRSAATAIDFLRSVGAPMLFDRKAA